MSDTQKDELIVGLWETLRAMEPGGAVGPVASDAPSQRHDETLDDLRSRIGGAPASRRAWHAGKRRGFLESGLLLGFLCVIGVGFAGDFAIGWYQQRSATARNRAALALENAALSGLYVELVRITQEPDGKSYRAAMGMHNSSPGTPLFIMLNPVRVFVQVGLAWQEMPSRAPPGVGWGVVKLTDDDEYQVVFQVVTTDWAELMPGYMHIRIESDMLISQSSEPRNDIVERNNRFNAYLKPHNADDEAIKRRSKFPGPPPEFIPMPPH